jgi:hypothetical protein
LFSGIAQYLLDAGAHGEALPIPSIDTYHINNLGRARARYEMKEKPEFQGYSDVCSFI